MKKKIFFSLLAMSLAITVFLVVKATVKANVKPEYQFGEIMRGDVESVITSTGTLNPVGSVEVGTQVSGTISGLYVDFNDRVRKGQLLAVLDTLLLKATVIDARANLEKANAQVDEAGNNYRRNKHLFEKGFLSEAEFSPFEIQLKIQHANLQSAEANLQRAERNLKYAVISSPINGYVIQRSVEAGQTVAASMSTPKLFVIAEDLAKMEIHVQVDEGDIGQIKVGQRVRFTVQTYPNKLFSGAVRQIRLQPQTVQNVVMYTVVVDAANNEKLLLPGMTATVDFIVDERHDVLLAPNAALRFQPTEEMISQIRGKINNRAGSNDATGNTDAHKTRARLWRVDGKGRLTLQTVRTGVTDSKVVELVDSGDLTEGTKVITGIVQTDSEQQKSQSPSTTFRPRPF